MLNEEQAYSDEEDVDLYGQQLDEEELEEYENEGNSQQQLQLEQDFKPVRAKGRKLYKRDENQEDEDNG